MSENPDLQQIDLRTLVGHTTAVQGEVDEVVSEVERFTGTRKFGDDVCVLAMELMP